MEIYRSLFENSRDALMVLAPPTWTFIRANAAAVKMFGTSSEAEFTELSPWQISPGRQSCGRPSAEKAQEMIAAAMRDGFHSFSWEHQRLDGRPFAADVLLTRIDTSGGSFLQATVRDISVLEAERLRSYERQSAAEGKFRSLVENAVAAIFIIQDGRLTYVNSRCAEILSINSPDELIGTNLLDRVVEADRGRVEDILRQLTDGALPSLRFDLDMLCRDGRTIQVGTNVSVAVHEGQPAVVGMLQDISEKKLAEQQMLRHIAQLNGMLMGTVSVVTMIGEMRDPYTAGHERRVADIAVAIGAKLGLDAFSLEGLRVASSLHDIGKIALPAEILSKPGRLSSVEFELIKGHALAGYDILKDVEFPWPVALVASQHHERINGTGYPHGIKGGVILPEAQIVAVADVVEAISSHRPYRAALGIEMALTEILHGRGIAYDADVVDACRSLFLEGDYVLPA